MNKKNLCIFHDSNFSGMKLVQWATGAGYNVVIATDSELHAKQYRVLGKPNEIQFIDMQSFGMHNSTIILASIDIIINFSSKKLIADCIKQCINIKPDVMCINSVYSGDISSEMLDFIIANNAKQSMTYTVIHSFLYGAELHDISHTANFYKRFRVRLLPFGSDKLYLSPLNTIDLMEGIARIIKIQPEDRLFFFKGTLKYSVNSFTSKIAEFVNVKPITLFMPKRILKLLHKLGYLLYRNTLQWRNVLIAGDCADYIENSNEFKDIQSLKVKSLTSFEATLPQMMKCMYSYKDVDRVGLDK